MAFGEACGKLVSSRETRGVRPVRGRITTGAAWIATATAASLHPNYRRNETTAPMRPQQQSSLRGCDVWRAKRAWCEGLRAGKGKEKFAWLLGELGPEGI